MPFSSLGDRPTSPVSLVTTPAHFAMHIHNTTHAIRVRLCAEIDTVIPTLTYTTVRMPQNPFAAFQPSQSPFVVVYGVFGCSLRDRHPVVAVACYVKSAKRCFPLIWSCVKLG